MNQPAGRATYSQSKARYSWSICRKISPYKQMGRKVKFNISLSLTREALPADVAEGAPGVVGDVPLVRLRHPGRGRRSGGLQSVS